MQGKADLRYVFQNALRQRYFMFDLIEERPDVGVHLVPATEEEAKNELYWPRIGIFSRSHTYREENAIASIVGKKTYFIDGTWGASDFSRFYGKVADLYALFAVLGEAWDKLEPAAKASVTEIVKSKAYRGGGSYVGLYDQLFDKLPSFHFPALEVKKIQYASPGTLVLSGDTAVLAEVGNSIQSLEEKRPQLHQLYKSIHGTLAKEGLLAERVGWRSLPPQLRNHVKTSADALAALLGIDYAKTLFEVADKNILTYSKIVLSIYRRVEGVHLYQEEGRVQPAKQ